MNHKQIINDSHLFHKDIVQDYLTLWQNHWQDLWQVFDPQSIVSSLFNQTGLTTTSLVAQNPFLFRQARHPSKALSLHLSTTLAIWGAAQGSLMPFLAGTIKFNNISVDDLRQKIQQIGASQFSRILTQEIVERSTHLMEGVQGYLNHPYRRPEHQRPVVWSQGAARLLDYSDEGASGPIILVIPSLINKSYVLDLKTDQSLLKYLTRQGVRPFLLDWGEPGLAENEFGLDEYFLTIVKPAYDFLKSQGKVSVIGYCMGGLFATALAQSQPSIQKLILLATPWDFSQHPKPLSGYFETILTHLDQSSSDLPPEVLQLLFYGLQPGKILEKYMNFRPLKQSTPTDETFVALEDWVNDGVALTNRVARQCFSDWFDNNLPAQDLWKIGSMMINPSAIAQPTYIVNGKFDKIVPMASSKKLADKIKKSEFHIVPFGHTGPMASPRAEKDVWEPMLKWLKLADS